MSNALSLFSGPEARIEDVRAELSTRGINIHTARPDERAARLRQLTETTLRRAVDDHRRGRESRRLREDLQQLCTEARVLALHAEEMLIIVKESWRSLSETQTLDHREADAMLGDIVTRSIREFYRDD